MKPSEFRIGNYATIDNPDYYPTMKDIPLVVSGIAVGLNTQNPKGEQHEYILSLGTKEECGKDPSYFQFIRYIKPIVLTDKWAVKFGYENLHEMALCFCDESPFKPTITAEYLAKFEVHQAQNLFYWLNGKELELERD